MRRGGRGLILKVKNLLRAEHDGERFRQALKIPPQPPVFHVSHMEDEQRRPPRSVATSKKTMRKANRLFIAIDRGPALIHTTRSLTASSQAVAASTGCRNPNRL